MEEEGDPKEEEEMFPQAPDVKSHLQRTKDLFFFLPRRTIGSKIDRSIYCSSAHRQQRSSARSNRNSARQPDNARQLGTSPLRSDLKNLEQEIQRSEEGNPHQNAIRHPMHSIPPFGLTGARPSGLTSARPSGLTGARPSGLTGVLPFGLTSARSSGLTGARSRRTVASKTDQSIYCSSAHRQQRSSARSNRNNARQPDNARQPGTSPISSDLKNLEQEIQRSEEGKSCQKAEIIAYGFKDRTECNAAQKHDTSSNM
ncbi:hypothetical protein LR48_Vigan03g116100 [Vigna angularis]|uniref:Uncharacterized protein n=1 Tax=Phaseolus angularis TaxID=3914 RepID=A0A0L9U5S5_PHAAN|nr:hypothetical protein LR48_Vigan03g116100 [Vigna angularis]